jgi:hypothetical protein
MTKAKKWTVLALFCLVGSFVSAVPTVGYGSSNSTQSPAQEPQPMNQMADCSKLSSDAQDFADELNASNKMMFCNKFNDAQRNSAMDMSGTMGKDGKLMTNDQAVEKVARDNNMMAPAKPSTTRPGGSCPVK